MSERVRCINPRCGRSWDPAKIGGWCECICSKCMRLAPAERRRYRALKRMVNHAKRYPHKWTRARRAQLFRLFDWNWERLKRRFTAPQDRPFGLDAFLAEEMGWRR